MRWLTGLIFFLPTSLLAQPSGAEIIAVEPLSAGHLLKLTGALLMIVLIIFSVSWLVKKFYLRPQKEQDLLQVVATAGLGARDRIVLIQVGEVQILLGVSPGRIETLHQLQEPLTVTKTTLSSLAFADKLSWLMRR